MSTALPAATTLGTKEKPNYVRIDGFSERDDNPLKIPNDLFFGPEREVDLSAAYGAARYHRAKVCGLIHTLDRYKFTVAENTLIEEEIALAPALLGKVFENLLAAYNPATGATARKQTGSFYTQREGESRHESVLRLVGMLSCSHAQSDCA